MPKEFAPPSCGAKGPWDDVFYIHVDIVRHSSDSALTGHGLSIAICITRFLNISANFAEADKAFGSKETTHGIYHIPDRDFR